MRPGVTKKGMIHLRRPTKLQLVKAVQALEARGWECCIPIRAVPRKERVVAPNARYECYMKKCNKGEVV
ncbi:hypothetical protein [Ectobacillus ponti]|uniref:Uncharacterized protein n=1 Tax=Ectobacillus ponti TaxID=2961894 RepID=A0AA42BUH5_9BACI|nr:hypothetical protein [Ectobacillus ponti]MCP8970543.1 hypothetical protein [Ectobacillus ponti]